MFQLVGDRFSKNMRDKLSTNVVKIIGIINTTTFAFIHFTVIHISMLSIAQPKMKIKVNFRVKLKQQSWFKQFNISLKLHFHQFLKVLFLIHYLNYNCFLTLEFFAGIK